MQNRKIGLRLYTQDGIQQIWPDEEAGQGANNGQAGRQHFNIFLAFLFYFFF